MTNEQLATMLRAFTARSAEISGDGAVEDKTWRLADGVYVFPDGRCPYCREPITSNRIWKIEGRILVGRWKIRPGSNGRPGRLVRERYGLHPHVNGNGICQGSAATGADALFTAMNPGDSFDSSRSTWTNFLTDVWDHGDCAVLQGRRMPATSRSRQNWAGTATVPETPPVMLPELDEEDDEDIDDDSDDEDGECTHSCCAFCCRENGCGYEWPSDDDD